MWSNEFARDYDNMQYGSDLRDVLVFRGDLVLIGQLGWPLNSINPVNEYGAIAFRSGMPDYVIPETPLFAYDDQYEAQEDPKWVRCGMVHDGRLILGGSFREAGGVVVKNIVAVDPGAPEPVSALGEGLDRSVEAVGSFRGSIVAGFALLSPAASNALLREFDGAQWNAIPFPDGIVLAAVSELYEWNDQLWVGGMFLEAGQKPSDGRGLAVWDGDDWSWPGGGLPSDTPTHDHSLPEGIQGVTSILQFQGDLYAAGSFRNEAEGSWGIARLDGAHWTALPTTHTDIRDLVETPDGLVALGDFRHRLADQSESHAICAWNGSNWIPLGDSPQGFVEPDVLGQAGVMWDGQLWIADIAQHGPWGEGWDVGVISFDGEGWRRPMDAHGVLGWVHDIHATENAVIVTGAFEFANGLYSPLVTRWSGDRFEPMYAGLQHPSWRNGPEQRSMLLDFQGDLLLIGAFRLAGEGAQNVAQWDGSSWRALGEGLQHSGADVSVVSDAETYDGQLVVGGYFNCSGTRALSSLATWDGSQWQPWPVQFVSYIDEEGAEQYPDVNHILAVGEELWIAGSRLSVDGTNSYKIMRWSGSEWIPHPFQPSASVRELVDTSDAVMAQLGWQPDENEVWLLSTDSAERLVDPVIEASDRGISAYAGNPGEQRFIIDGQVYEFRDGAFAIPATETFQVEANSLRVFEISSTQVLLGGFERIVVDGQESWGIAMGDRTTSVPVLVAHLSVHAILDSNRLRCEVTGWNGPVHIELQRRDAAEFWNTIGFLRDFHGSDVATYLDESPSDGLQFYRAIIHAGTERIYSNEVEFARQDATGVPAASYLVGATPNPFNPSTRVDFVLARSGPVHVEVVGLNGRRVLDEKLGELPAGSQSWSWNGRDGGGSAVASGSYLVRVMAPDRNLVARVQLIK